MSETVIRELTPELLGDFLRFFDDDAFAGNPSSAHWNETLRCKRFLADPVTARLGNLSSNLSPMANLIGQLARIKAERVLAESGLLTAATP